MSEIPTFPFLDREVIQLTAEGVWLADGEEITHERTRQAFERHLAPSTDGQGWEIRIGREQKRIEVEDTAFFVSQIEGNPEVGYQLRLTDGTLQKLDPTTLRYSAGRLVCLIDLERDGRARKFEARFLRPPYYELLSHSFAEGALYRLTIEGYTLTLQE